MTRDELLAQLQGHGNHLVVVKGTSAEDLARGLGLMLLGLEELLREQRGQVRGQRGEALGLEAARVAYAASSLAARDSIERSWTR